MFHQIKRHPLNLNCQNLQGVGLVFRVNSPWELSYRDSGWCRLLGSWGLSRGRAGIGEFLSSIGEDLVDLFTNTLPLSDMSLFLHEWANNQVRIQRFCGYRCTCKELHNFFFLFVFVCAVYGCVCVLYLCAHKYTNTEGNSKCLPLCSWLYFLRQSLMELKLIRWPDCRLVSPRDPQPLLPEMACVTTLGFSHGCWGARPHVHMFAEQVLHTLSHLPSPQELNSCESWNIKSLQEKKKDILQLFKRKGLQTQPRFYKKKKSNQREAQGRKKYQSTSLGNW